MAKTRIIILTKKLKTLIVIGAIIITLLSLAPFSPSIVYEAIFGVHYDTEDYLRFSPEDFSGLKVERSDFSSDGLTLAGYKYSKEGQTVKGVVIVAHGLGSGHSPYTPFINEFVSNGYYVFSYDAHGNDNTDKVVRGFPQGIIDLHNAIDYVKTIEEYKNLPIALFGHSWGGYSVANVLNVNPEVKAVAIIAGFNESEDMLAYHGERVAGKGSLALMPFLTLHERVKFKKEYSDITAIGGLKNTSAGVLVAHSKDDATVPIKYGYDKFYSEFKNSSRFVFDLYEDRGHTDLLYSERAILYRKQIVPNYNAQSAVDVSSLNIDRKLFFEPNPLLFEKIIDLYDEYCAN